MKKVITIILIFLVCETAQALPVGNPSEASLYLTGAWCSFPSCLDPNDSYLNWARSWSFRIGYYGDFVFNRHMKTAHNAFRRSAIQKTKMMTNAAYFALNVCNRLDLFTTVGVSDLAIRTNGSSFTTVNELIDLEFLEKFSWSIGLRATLWQYECLSLGFESQYFQFNPKLEHALLYHFGEFVYFNVNNGRQRYKEWQVGVGLSYRFATGCPTVAWIPYAAIKWSRAKLNLRNQTFADPNLATRIYQLPNLISQNPWGGALGMTFELCDTIGVSVEGRWVGEKGFYINGQFRF